MANADSSQSQLSYVEEVTWGTTPSAALQIFRGFTGESLVGTAESFTSEEIRSDRQIADVVRTKNGAGGDVNFELSYGSFDDFIEGLLFSDWSADLALAATDIEVDDADQSFNTAGAVTFANMAVGQWIKVAGFTTAANNGYFRVVSKTATKVVVTDGTTLVDEAAGDSVTIKGSVIQNGTTVHSYSLEKKFADITKFLSYTGMKVGSMSLSIASGAPIRGAFSFLGKGAAAGTATIGNGSYTAAPTAELLNGITNVAAIREAGAAVTGNLLELTLNVSNALREQPAIGSSQLIGIGAGTMEVTGSIRAYFSGFTQYDKFLADTSSYMSFRITDAAGNTYILGFHRLKFSGGTIVAAGKDQDVIADLPFTAYRDGTIQKTLSFNRFAA